MVVPVTIGPVRASGVPSLDSCASTTNKKISEPTIAEFNCTVQVKVKSDPTVWMPELPLLLVSVIED